MNTTTLSNLRAPSQVNGQDSAISARGYTVLEGHTASKSLLSTAKNLLYSLSKPFRATAHKIMEDRLGARASATATANIRTSRATPSPSQTQKSPAQSQRSYTVVSSKSGYKDFGGAGSVGEHTGHGKSSILGRIWG